MHDPHETPDTQMRPQAVHGASHSGAGSSATPEHPPRGGLATEHSRALPFGSPVVTPQSVPDPANLAPTLPPPGAGMPPVSDIDNPRPDVDEEMPDVDGNQNQDPQLDPARDGVAGAAELDPQPVVPPPVAPADGEPTGAQAGVDGALGMAALRAAPMPNPEDQSNPRGQDITVSPDALNALMADAMRRGAADERARARERDCMVLTGAHMQGQTHAMQTPSPSLTMRQPQLAQTPDQELLLQQIAAAVPQGTQVIIVGNGLPGLPPSTSATPAALPAPPLQAAAASQASALAKSNFYRPARLDEKKLEQCRGPGGADRLRRHLDILKMGIERSGANVPKDFVFFLDVSPFLDFTLALTADWEQSGKPFDWEKFREALVRYHNGEVRSSASIALDEILNGQVVQGRDPVAVYAERFRQKAQLLPRESPQSLCAHYLRGMDPDLRGYCRLDDQNKEWSDLGALLEYSRAQELRWQPHKTQAFADAAARAKDAKRPRITQDQGPSVAAVVGRNTGASCSRAATAAPATPVVAAATANPSPNPRPQPSRPAPSPGPRLSQALSSATDPARMTPLPKGSFVGSQGTLYNREAWMYKDPLCPVTLCDGYDSKTKLMGADGDIIRRELTLSADDKQQPAGKQRFGHGRGHL